MTAAADDRAFIGHPKGLGYLAFTEAWERFSYYGMQSLLVLYLAKYLLVGGNADRVALFGPFSRLYGGLEGAALASAIFGTYASLVYFTPMLGGMVADRWIGKKRAVIAGALTMALGHFLMAFDVSFLFALLALIVGNGLFKPNLASQIGALYAPDDLRRADAFQIYYIAIASGVVFSPLIVGSLGEKMGWHWGFGAAGIGMIIGLGIYLAGQRHLPAEHMVARRRDAAAADPMTVADWRMFGVVLLLVPVLALALIPNQEIFNAYLLWGDRDFDLEFMGAKLPTTWLITLDAITSTALMAAVVVFYRWYGKRRAEPDEFGKMVIGCGFVALGMLCLYLAAATQSPGGKIGLFWPVAFHVINSIGFAHVMPVALALFVRLAPRQIASTVVGIYSMAFFAATALTGWISSRFDTMAPTRFWLLHAALAGLAGLAFWGLKVALSRWQPTGQSAAQKGSMAA